MFSDRISDSLPDLVVLLARDGTVLDLIGGSGVPAFNFTSTAIGKRIESLWPQTVATTLEKTTRRAFATRSAAEITVRLADRLYQVRVTSHGPSRAICVIRPAYTGALALSEEHPEESDDGLNKPLRRREFLAQLGVQVAAATSSAQSICVAVIAIEGVAEIRKILDTHAAEQVHQAALLRLGALFRERPPNDPHWQIGQISEGTVAVTVASEDRALVESIISRLCDSLRSPIIVGDAAFHLTPYAGVALLAQDASSSRMLLDHARFAASEAKKHTSLKPWFFTDGLKLKSLAKLDIAHELRLAIENGDIRCRYLGRHHLESGRLVARVAYLNWEHPVRGNVRPAEFIGIAQATGLERTLSLSLIARLKEDIKLFAQSDREATRVSFGPLRQHFLHKNFISDLSSVLSAGEILPQNFELRISEEAFVSCALRTIQELEGIGIHLVIDEIGRDFCSINRLAKTKLWGLQLDRSWAIALRDDAVALMVCRTMVAIANTLEVNTIATGIDNEDQRQILSALGCEFGMGDLYAEAQVTAVHNWPVKASTII